MHRCSIFCLDILTCGSRPLWCMAVIISVWISGPACFFWPIFGRTGTKTGPHLSQTEEKNHRRPVTVFCGLNHIYLNRSWPVC
jgi:hypothetical protein